MSNQSENIADLAHALSKCQGQMAPAIKDSINPHFKNKFATLYSIWEACRKPLSDNGLSVVQTMSFENERLCLTTKLMHLSGQWISSITQVVSAKQDAQGIGSALSYFKRYSLAALLGVCTADEDDDGNGAMPNGKEKSIKAESPPVGKEEIRQLNEMADQCDPEYMAKVFSYLESQGCKGWDKVKMDMFAKIMEGMKKNAASYQGVKNV